MRKQTRPQEPVWLADRQSCAARHTPDPPGYEEWFTWAAWMGETHVQTQCSECGLWAIWIPKTPDPAQVEVER
jgi:hypothetical protein